MKLKHFVYALLIASVPFFAGSASAEPTLWGIYGAHNLHDCPVNNRETAKAVITLNAMDLKPLMEKYGVTRFLDRYHSGLEHTLPLGRRDQRASGPSRPTSHIIWKSLPSSSASPVGTT